MKGYWDIEDYLEGEETVSYSSEEKDLLNHLYITPHNTRSSAKRLPLWLAKALAIRSLGTVHMPMFLTPDYRGNFASDPEILTLPKYSHYFYEISGYFSLINADTDLIALILNVLMSRIRSLIKYLDIQIPAKQLLRLTNIEQIVYESLRKSALDIEDWKDRLYDRLTPTSRLQYPRKRLKLSTKSSHSSNLSNNFLNS